MDSNDMNGHVILLMAPSGSGKQSMVDCVHTQFAERLHKARTLTSRARREGAFENPLYTFVSAEDFKTKIGEGYFAEWAEFGGNYYGTPKEELTTPLYNGQVVFKEMELQGVEQVRALIPKERMTVLFIDAGPWEALERRITARAPISDAELKKRKERYTEEVKAKDAADIIIENFDGGLEAAKQQFCSVLGDILETIES